MSNELIQENIKKYGWQCQNVFDENGETEDFFYSIGFEETFNYPEVMVFGLQKEATHTILSNIAFDLKEGKTFEENIRIKGILSGDYEVMFKPVIPDSLAEYAGIASRYYKKPFRVLVMLWPDKSNILPTEVGCELTVQNEALKII